MSYSEISNDFLHAASLHSEIKRFRMERLSEILEDNTGMFGVIHVIPASFTNPADFVSMCDLGKVGKLPLPTQLNNYIRGMMVPNVDGVWFPSDDGLRDFELLRLFNNGSVELKMDLYTRVSPKIDRDRTLCNPIEIKDISDAENVKDMIEECQKMTKYAIGMR